MTLVGRPTERGRISRLLEAAREQRSDALVLSGEPGIGKSALCDWARAQARGMRLLSARGLESEVDLPFAGLSELCARELDQIRLLPRPQAQALEGVLSGEGANTGDRLSLGVAILGLLAAIAQEAPVLVLVDDAQWLDRASAETLLFVARRLGKEGIALLVATRPAAVFDTDRPGVPRVPLTGLDETSARSLLENAHGPLAPQAVELLRVTARGSGRA